MPAYLQETLDFLRDLRGHNNRDWFHANRASYDRARGDFESLTVELISRFGEVDDLGSLAPEQAMFRIHRDVRFSADKSPYKTNMGALLGKQGRKTTGRANYFQIEPDGGSLAAGGLFMVSPQGLETVRQAIARDDQPLRSLIAADSFKQYFGQISGEQVKTAPRGYSPDLPAIDLLRHKRFEAVHPLSDQQVLADDLVAYLLDVFRALKPFTAYFADLLGEQAHPQEN